MKLQTRIDLRGDETIPKSTIYPPSMRKPWTSRILGLLIAVLVVLVFLAGSGDPEVGTTIPPGLEGIEPPAEEDVLSLLDGLRRGDSLGSGVVLAIDAPNERIVWVDIQVEGGVFGVGIGAKGTGGDRVMPLTTDRYEIQYGWVRGGEIAPHVMLSAAEEVANRVRRREQEVPLPKGM